MSALGIIPVYVTKRDDVEVVARTLRTLKAVEPELEVLVIDDASPDQESLDQVRDMAFLLGYELHKREENGGFSRTVNVGLQRALDEGRDAILINADMEFNSPFVDLMTVDNDMQGRPAAIVGALLLYPSGLIQHAGIFFSFMSRAFDHRHRFGPGMLPEAQRPLICPVTGALQFIRHSTLEQIGLYDEDYRMGFEDVDYCLRAFDNGLECVYDPRIIAIHHESLFRGQRTERLDNWHRESLEMLYKKHGQSDLGRWVLPIR